MQQRRMAREGDEGWERKERKDLNTGLKNARCTGAGYGILAHMKRKKYDEAMYRRRQRKSCTKMQEAFVDASMGDNRAIFR